MKDAKDYIIVKGAKVHNLKNVTVAIPRYKMTVLTGLSGSGKSSLAFDTLYAEGQRRYVESLSSYARQFLQRMDKPDVDFIKGLAPAVAIEQKVRTRNPRSTVGTSTEVYEYLKLLYARIGKTISPVSGKEVKRHSVSDVTDYICQLQEGQKLLVLFPVEVKSSESAVGYIQMLVKQGFSRAMLQSEIYMLTDLLADTSLLKKDFKGVVVDRLIVKPCDTDFRTCVADSIETAFYEGGGHCRVVCQNKKGTWETVDFSNKFEADGMQFVKPSPNFFSFNNPYGACDVCEGFGSVLGIDEDLVIPNSNLSVYDNAVACWNGEKLSAYKNDFIMKAYEYDFPIHKPYNELSEKDKDLLWNGRKDVFGINDFFKLVESKTYKIQYRIILARYKGKTQCPSCRGSRLRKDASYVKINGKSLSDLVLLPICELSTFFDTLEMTKHEASIAKRLLIEIKNRLGYLIDVGLPYLTLNRLSNTLSGGESQRINLATSLGSKLVGAMYILDEPTIGLHPRDNERLVQIMKKLKAIGNTVIVVEHDEEIIEAADEIIDIGPLAGQYGGEVVFQGTYNKLLGENTLTANYLNKKLAIEIPASRRKWKEHILVKGARENNLKNIDVKIPLGILTVVTGVSGSGKTTLIRKILYNGLKRALTGLAEKAGKHDQILFDSTLIKNIVLVDQNPIGKSSRSNPATYLKIFDDIRALYANQKLAVVRGYKPGFFSFNIQGGRCEECQGEGEVTISMQFMADIKLKCEACNGKRFKSEILDVKYGGLDISEILELTIEEADEFFRKNNKDNSLNKVLNKIKPLIDVGLGYLRLGQSSSSLSGGEAQRIKLASFLTKGGEEDSCLFIFDEPTIGLHFHDINKLYASFNELINNGHSIVVIEHNLDIVKCADWIIDLGKEGGDKGGDVLFEGVPEALIKCKESHTGQYLRKKMK